MAFIAVTYSNFVNGTAADADQVDQNFSDIVNGLSDGTKDFSMMNGTLAGNLTVNGNTTIGSASSDTLTITASMASTVNIGTTFSYDIGSSTIGLRDVYFGSADSAARTTKIRGATVASSWTMTLPTGVGTINYTLETDGAGATSWTKQRRSSMDLEEYSLATSVSGNALTITLKGADGNDLSSTNYATLLFRSATISSGAPVERKLTSNLTLTVPSGATLGHIDGQTQNIYVYAIDNSGTVALACSGVYFDEGVLASTTAMSTSADSNRVLYDASGLTDKAVRFLGLIEISETTAGIWAAAATRISLRPVDMNQIYAIYTRGSSATVTNNTDTLVNFATKVADSHNCVTTGTWVFTAPRSGIYRIDASAQIEATSGWATTEQFDLRLYKNGSYHRRIASKYVDAGAASIVVNAQGGTLVECAAGDTLDIRVYQNNGADQVIGASADYNWVTIHFLGAKR